MENNESGGIKHEISENRTDGPPQIPYQATVNEHPKTVHTHQDNAGKPKKDRKGCMFFTIAICAVLFLTITALLIVGAVLAMIGSGVESLYSIPATQHYPAKSFKEEHISGSSLAKDKILIIDVRGVILGGYDRFSEVANSDSICEMLEQARKDKDVKAIVLRLDTPGGEVTAADMIHHKIQELQKEGITIVSSMGSMAASGGYYIAAPTDFIMANRLTMTGSIGVIIQTYNYHDLLNKIGVFSETYKSGLMKDMLDGSKIRTDGEKKIVQKMVDDVYSEFVRIVADGRKDKGVTEEKIRTTEIGDGRVISGQDAFNLGLVDGLGYFDDSVEKAAELGGTDNYKVICYVKRFTFMDIFSEVQASSPELKLKVSGKTGWADFVEPGKLYFLPSF